jgi:hypothetical protein
MAAGGTCRCVACRCAMACPAFSVAAQVEQMEGAPMLDEAISWNLKELGYGG